MKAYTLENPGRLVPGIELTGGRIDLGVCTYDGAPVMVPTDPRAAVVDGRLTTAPGRGALLLVRDHAPAQGSWHLRAAQPDERWDAMRAADAIPNAIDRILAAKRVRNRYPHHAPVGWYEFARGSLVPDGAADARPLVTLYGYLEDGSAFELRRRGRIGDTPGVFLVACRGDEVTVTDPREATAARAARMLGDGGALR